MNGRSQAKRFESGSRHFRQAGRGARPFPHSRGAGAGGRGPGPPPAADRGLRPARHRRPPLAGRAGDGLHPGHRAPRAAGGVHGVPPHRDRGPRAGLRRRGLVERRGGDRRTRQRRQRCRQRHVPGSDPGRREHRRARHDHDQAQPALQRAGAMGAGLRRGLLRRVHGRRHRRHLRARGPDAGKRPGPPAARGHGRRQGVLPRAPRRLQPGGCEAGAHRRGRLGLAAPPSEGVSQEDRPLRALAGARRARALAASGRAQTEREGRPRERAPWRPSTARSGMRISVPAG